MLRENFLVISIPEKIPRKDDDKAELYEFIHFNFIQNNSGGATARMKTT